MKKRFLAILLALCMVLALLSASAFAEEVTVIASGECGAEGDNVTWTLDSEGTLTLSGTGATDSWNYPNEPPWDNYGENIRYIVIGEGITHLGHGGWWSDSLIRITISASVKEVVSPISLGGSGLAEIVVAADNKDFCSIDGVLFSKDKTTLIKYPRGKQESQYIIPDGVVNIQEHAFYYTKLSSVIFPNSLRAIDCRAFEHCSLLTAVTLPEGLTFIGTWGFLQCGLESVTVPASVTKIGGSLSSGVVGEAPFHDCDNLTSIVVKPDNPNYSSEDGVLFNKDKTRLIEYPAGKKVSAYTVPEGVEIIAYYAFQYCTKLTSLKLPSSLRIIEEYAISWCKLENLAIPDGTIKIGPHSLEFDHALTAVTIPTSVEKIGQFAFSNCSNLKDIYYLGSEKRWTTLVCDPQVESATPDETFEGIRRDATIHYAINSYTLTYAANGGGGSMDSALAEDGETLTLPACTFTTPTGKEFKAWSIDGTEYAPGDVYTVTADTTVTAVWKNDSTFCTLSGAITGHQNAAYTSVTARLVGLDGTEYPADVTGGESLDGTIKKECTYSVSAPAGQYNLVVEATTASGTVVNRTALVKLTGDQTKSVNLPNGQAKSAVNAKTGKAAIVGNLDSLIVSDDGAMLEGASAGVTLTVDSVGTAAPEAMSIQSAAPGQTLEFVELSIQKTVDGATTDVTDTGDTLIEIVLPFESTGKSNIKVYRYHNGKVDTLTEQAASGERIGVTDGSVTIYAKKFSVYAIGYTASTADPVTSSKPTTPSRPSSGGGSSRYSVSIPASIIGGTVAVQPTSASAGSRVTITANPNSGYELDTLTVTNASGNRVSLTNQGNNQYTFTMPGGKVTVNAVFGKTWSNPFSDVAESSWYYNAVKFANENGLMSGGGDGLFAPEANLTRAQFAQILCNREGRPTTDAGTAFTDVASNTWYANAVNWAAASGIVGGYGDGRFGPDDNITREQLAVMLWRYAGSPAVANRELRFTDADSASGYALEAMRWAVENGVINGYGNGQLGPQGLATRAQVAQMLKNYMER